MGHRIAYHTAGNWSEHAHISRIWKNLLRDRSLEKNLEYDKDHKDKFPCSNLGIHGSFFRVNLRFADCTVYDRGFIQTHDRTACIYDVN